MGGHGRSMSDSDVRQRADRSQSAGRPLFDLVATKLRRPVIRPGTVRRSSLIERLRRAEARPIVSIVGPAGYGKTTVLSQWAEHNGQSFAWVSVDEPDNDPKVLLTGAPVRAAVRGGGRAERIGCDPGGSGPVELAAGAAGPARGVVPLPPPVPRHAAGGAGTPRARPDARPAPPRGWLVPGERPARGGAGVLDGGRGHGRCSDGETRGAGSSARPGPDRPAVAWVAGGPGRHRGTPDDRGPGRAVLRADRPAGRGRAVWPAWSIAGSTGIQRGPTTPPPRPGPP